jgi:YggT family protein
MQTRAACQRGLKLRAAPAKAALHSLERKRMAAGLLTFIYFVLGALILLIIIQAILSWLVAFNVINTRGGVMSDFLRALDRMTQPIYRPIRKILPDFGGIDFSPLVVLLLLQALRMVVAQALAGMPY